MVGAHDHRDRVPADELPDAVLHRLVAGELGLLLRRDRVDVARLRERREADLQHPRALQQLVEDEPRAFWARLVDESVERLDPLLRLVGVDIGQLPFELIEDLVHLMTSLVTHSVGGRRSATAPAQAARWPRAPWRGAATESGAGSAGAADRAAPRSTRPARPA